MGEGGDDQPKGFVDAVTDTTGQSRRSVLRDLQIVRVLDTDQFEVLGENDMGEPVIGSPVPAGNRLLLLRGEKHLFGLAGE